MNVLVTHVKMEEHVMNSREVTCVTGYTDTNCQTEINECASNPCQNGGSCNDAIGSYSCTCVTGYRDTNCQTAYCPSSHPYAYYNGKYCCKTNKENYFLPQGESCDGSKLSITSLCCEGGEGIKCSQHPCSNSPSADGPKNNVMQLFSAFAANGSVQASNLCVMGKFKGFPQFNSHGRMYVGNVTDDKFRADEIITWKNYGKAGGYQLLGWQKRIFADNMLRLSFWIKFIGQVPPKSRNFGIKIYAKVYSEFVDKCTADKWFYITKTAKCRSSGDKDYVILLFDSIAHQQTIRISHLKVEILKEGPKYNVMQLFSAFAANGSVQASNLCVMGKFKGFPQFNSHGRMYVGNVIDDKFRADEIITWKNYGQTGGYQMLGWQNKTFADNMLRFSFWVKFIDQVPPKGEHFGIKIYGQMYRAFVDKCTADKWFYVTKTVKCRSSGDTNYVILLFDSIAHQQTARISHLKVEILKEE